MSELTPRANSHEPAAPDALATMNDHLARFFQHADTLLQDWQTYGDKLRQSIDSQVGRLEDKVANAVTDAGRAAAHKLDGQVEQSMAGSLAGLRRELDSLARIASQTASRMQGSNPHATAGGGTYSRGLLANPMLWALVAANIMLAVLIGMSVRSCQASNQAGAASALGGVHSAAPATPTTGDGSTGSHDNPGLAPGSQVDAGDIAGALPAIALDPEEAGEICTKLAREYDAEAVEILLRASVDSACGDEAPAVTETLLEHIGPKAGDKNKAGKQTDAKAGKAKRARPKGKGKAPGKAKPKNNAKKSKGK